MTGRKGVAEPRWATGQAGSSAGDGRGPGKSPGGRDRGPRRGRDDAESAVANEE